MAMPFISPELLNIKKAMVYTSTQLIKLGMVVKVCTTFLKGAWLIKLRKMAKAMGSQEKRMERPLMAKVFVMTLNICRRLDALVKRFTNQSMPTNLVSKSLKGGR
jgi:hypothetical protein